MRDVDKISDKSVLPLFGISYGPLEHEYEQFSIKVGPLECLPNPNVQRYSLKNHINGLELKIEENHNGLIEKLENVDANISLLVQSDNYQTQQLTKLAVDRNAHTEQSKNLTFNKVGQNEEFEQDIDCPTHSMLRQIQTKNHAQA